MRSTNSSPTDNAQVNLLRPLPSREGYTALFPPARPDHPILTKRAGPTVLHQVPEGSVIPCRPSPTAQEPLFDFGSISDYIIPRREFCDRLIAVCANKHRIIGFPVCIHDDEKYQRNDFIFNFCLVLDEDASFGAYASVVRKLARLFRNLEEQGDFLSREERMEGLVLAGEEGYGGGAKVYALCEMVLEDLNNYCECMIPIGEYIFFILTILLIPSSLLSFHSISLQGKQLISNQDESNTLNLKLFPTRAPPPPIHTWHVPLSTVRFSSLQTSSWDLTVQRIVPHINGINSVSKIAQLADTDISLTRRAIAHLLYYGCILLLDIFQFGAIYAPTAEIRVFVADAGMQEECKRYITSPFSPFATKPLLSKSGNGGGGGGGSRLNPAAHATAATSVVPPSTATILHLYSSLRQGLTLRDWCLLHSAQLASIDIRRLVTFGVIKGFLYRVHKHAVALRHPNDHDNNGGGAIELEDPVASARLAEKAWRKAAMSSGWRTPTLENPNPGPGPDPGDDAGNGIKGENEKGKENAGENRKVLAMRSFDLADHALARYLDGLHCLDEICEEVGLSERDAVRKLKGFGDVVFVCR